MKTPDGQTEAMDPQLTTIQPGGGVVMSIELLWGRWRRWLLRKVRPGYVAKMTAARQGHRGSLPFEPVDARDLKYYRNQETYWWSDSDDQFAWRDALPFVRVGLAELILLGLTTLILAAMLGWLWWPLSIPMLVVFVLIVWFFRDPNREIPNDVGTVVAPADGKVVQIDEIDDPIVGPAIQIGIFLSIFNVHANRTSLPGEVVQVTYRPGKFLNALRPESARENENLDVVLKVDAAELVADPELAAHGFIRIRQITGQFARRIVCWVRIGDVLRRGEQFGMIKLGSRTELVVPRSDRLQIAVAIGDKIKAGSTIMARYRYRMGSYEPTDQQTASDESPSGADVSEPTESSVVRNPSRV